MGAANGPHKLLKVIKNPITDHLPPNCRIISMSVQGRLVSVPKFIPTLPNDVPHVYVAGAFAHGKAEAEYADECIAVSQYLLRWQKGRSPYIDRAMGGRRRSALWRAA